MESGDIINITMSENNDPDRFYAIIADCAYYYEWKVRYTFSQVLITLGINLKSRNCLEIRSDKFTTHDYL